jgi:small-conductance mechanosensitive channel
MRNALTKAWWAPALLLACLAAWSHPAAAQAPATQPSATQPPATQPPATQPSATQQATQPPAAGTAAPGAAQPQNADLQALIDVLQNDEARAKLIERLRAASAAAPEAAAPAAPQRSPVGALAEYTRNMAEGAAGIVDAVRSLIDEVTQIVTGASEIDLEALRRIAIAVALVVAATFVVYILLQILFRLLQRGFARRADGTRLFKRIRFISVSTLGDVGTVLLAWAAGYAFALNVGQGGRITLDQSLFLNAFLIVQLAKVATRTVLAPRWSALRIVPIEDTTAAYWYFWLSRLLSLIGYTLLFVAPILVTSVSEPAADVVRTIILFTALLISIAIVLQNRDKVRGWLMARAGDRKKNAFGKSLSMFARLWHFLAIAYLLVVFALWLADGNNALPFVLAATAKSAVAIVVGLIVNTLIYRLAAVGMWLPADIKERLPLLEARLDAFVPNVMRVVRLFVAVAVILTMLQVWQIADVTGWLASDAGQKTVTSLISAALVILAGSIIYLVVQSWIEYRLSPNAESVAGPRERTLLALFRNAFSIVLFVVMFMLVLAELGVNIGPLLAGAGVVGLAVGFGSQKLVQDVINGAFIQFENTMNEGDVVTAGDITGVVERLTIRSVSLRSLDGTYHVIPFSSVTTVSNLMKHFSYHLAAIGVAYRESIPEVKEAMEEAFERLKQSSFGPDIIGALEMHGVTEFADSAVIVRARIKTLPGKQWALGREYNELVKAVFDERGIEIPFPHVTLYLGEDKQGYAPPLHIQNAAANAGTASGEGTKEQASAGEPAHAGPVLAGTTGGASKRGVGSASD